MLGGHPAPAPAARHHPILSCSQGNSEGGRESDVAARDPYRDVSHVAQIHGHQGVYVPITHTCTPHSLPVSRSPPCHVPARSAPGSPRAALLASGAAGVARPRPRAHLQASATETVRASCPAAIDDPQLQLVTNCPIHHSICEIPLPHCSYDVISYRTPQVASSAGHGDAPGHVLCGGHGRQTLST